VTGPIDDFHRLQVEMDAKNAGDNGFRARLSSPFISGTPVRVAIRVGAWAERDRIVHIAPVAGIIGRGPLRTAGRY